MLFDLRFLHAGRDRSCPRMTSGSRCRRCQGAPTLPGASQAGCPQLQPDCCDRPAVGHLPYPVAQRLVAHLLVGMQLGRQSWPTCRCGNCVGVIAGF
jgi:hypothetical protein